MVSAFTGLLFNVMVARSLANAAGFGTWEVIVTLITFSAYPVGTVAYWTTREVSRGKMVGRTSLVAAALLSSLGLALYLAFTFVTYSAISSSLIPFLLGALIVPLSYWSAVTNSLVQGYRPAVYGWSLVISEFAKLATAYEVLYVYHLGLNGVILALMASYLIQPLVSNYFVRLTMAETFDWSLVRKWSGLAWLPLVSYLPTVVAVADTYVAAVGFGPGIVGYYQVAFIIASVVGYSGSLAFPLYPLLLRGGDERLPALGIEFTLMFSIPLAVGLAAMAGPILFLFSSRITQYTQVSTSLQILVLSSLIITISGVVDNILTGTERVDVGEKPQFWDLVRSNLLFVPIANILYGVVYVASLYFALAYSTSMGLGLSARVEVWAIVQAFAATLFLSIKARRARGSAKLLPSRSVLYYLLAAAVMGAVVYFASGALVSQGASTLLYGIQLVGVGALGVAVYFGVLLLADSRFRDLARAFVRRR
jgi:O-antigen/teichoic acid export membrane protein